MRLGLYGLGKIIVKKGPQKETCSNHNGTWLSPRRKRVGHNTGYYREGRVGG